MDYRYAEIIIDKDPERIIYPEMSSASSGLSAWLGPDSLGQNNWWQIVANPGSRVDISLDLQQPDRRQAVTWQVLDGRCLQ